MDETDWTLIDFEPPKKAAPVILKGCCQKCGKTLGKGAYMHVKHCKGAVDAD
jgi:hypothetical protein